MLANSWTYLYVLVMFLMILIEVVQISRDFGDNKLVNFIQLIIYVAILVVYWTQFGNSNFGFGAFLRITAFLFILNIILEIVFFPKSGKLDKKNREGLKKYGYLALLSGLKFLPIIILILYLTDSYM